MVTDARAYARTSTFGVAKASMRGLLQMRDALRLASNACVSLGRRKNMNASSDSSDVAPESVRSILIVEDEELVAVALREMLTDLGYLEIRQADTVESAIKSIDSIRPHIVILDASLRGIAAYRVAVRLKEQGIPFIVATGFDPKSLPPEFGFGIPLRKPYLIADLRRALEQATLRIASDAKQTERTPERGA